MQNRWMVGLRVRKALEPAVSWHQSIGGQRPTVAELNQLA
jgi:hypothetical protein